MIVRKFLSAVNGFCYKHTMKASIFQPAHIGEFVREIVEGRGLNVSSGARVLGVTRQTLSILLNCHGGLSSDMALRIEKADRKSVV